MADLRQSIPYQTYVDEWRLLMADLSGKRATFTAMPGKVIVEPIEEERYGGLILPTSRVEKASIGTIIGLGCKAPFLTMTQHYDDDDGYTKFDLTLGDVVLFGQNSGMNVEVGLGANRRKVIFLKESEIISKIVWEEVPTILGHEVRADTSVPHGEIRFQQGDEIVGRIAGVERDCPICGSINCYNADKDTCTACRLG